MPIVRMIILNQVPRLRALRAGLLRAGTGAEGSRVCQQGAMYRHRPSTRRDARAQQGRLRDGACTSTEANLCPFVEGPSCLGRQLRCSHRTTFSAANCCRNKLLPQLRFHTTRSLWQQVAAAAQSSS